jgi:hypothetical protein
VLLLKPSTPRVS